MYYLIIFEWIMVTMNKNDDKTIVDKKISKA